MAAIFKAANTAVITGGASGIGLAVAKKCAGHGMRVLVADWNAQGLETARSDLGSGALAVQMDVSKLEDWGRLKDVVSKEFGGQINFLALNAGIGLPSPFEGPGTENFHKTFDVNVFGVINGITTLLPLIQEKFPSSSSSPDDAEPEAAIVITGSKQGITNPPGSRPAYNASKAAVKSLAESLSFDLRANRRLGVHLLVPGWTWTGIAGANSGSQKPDAPWWPAQVAEYLEAKVRARQFWVLCPDNEVDEEMDRKRMLWNAEDPGKGRPPLSRWRDEYKEEFAEFMKKDL